MPAADLLADITLRPITDADRDFLYQVYAGTRQDEMALSGWTPEQIDEFLRMQFHAQHTFYQEKFRSAAFDVIERKGKPVGRLYLDRRPDELRIIDIALLPTQRQKGLGGALMRRILDEASTLGKPVRIHVERNNPAMRLYDRLGFQRIEDQGVYWLMEWRPRRRST